MDYYKFIELDDDDTKILKKAYKFVGCELVNEKEYHKTCIGELINLVDRLNDEVEHYKELSDQQEDEIAELMRNGGKYEEVD